MTKRSHSKRDALDLQMTIDDADGASAPTGAFVVADMPAPRMTDIDGDVDDRHNDDADLVLEEDFEFHDDVAPSANAWNFSKHRGLAFAPARSSTSIDEKISRRMSGRTRAIHDAPKKKKRKTAEEAAVADERRQRSESARDDADADESSGSVDEERRQESVAAHRRRKNGDDDDDDKDDEGAAQRDAEANAGADIVRVPQKKAGAKRRASKAAAFFSSLPKSVASSCEQFESLHLSRPLLKAINRLGWAKPTDVQAQLVPLALMGRDVCASAATGSGKTAAFALPILQRLQYRSRAAAAVRVVVLCPTRELAIQCHSVFESLAAFTDVECAISTGGMDSKQQEATLRQRPDIVVATCGRLIDHLHNTPSFTLENVEVLVMDEADRLLELGFEDELDEILRHCPRNRQTLLTSATMTESVDKLTKLALQNPVRVAADPMNQVAATLQQEFVRLRQEDEATREALLLSLCTRSFTSHALIFCRTKANAHRLKLLFGLAGLSAAELHGNLTQQQRLDALELFRDEKVDFLICTDVAARGLDIIGIRTVINYMLPRTLKQYIHRVGRTARAQRIGRSVSFCAQSDRRLLKEIYKRAPGKVLQRVLPPDSVAYWHQRIKELHVDMKEILKEERLEMELRKADVELRSAQNRLEFSAEILARPKRIWFQSEKERRDSSALDALSSVKELDEDKVKLARRLLAERSLKKRRLDRMRRQNDGGEREESSDDSADDGGRARRRGRVVGADDGDEASSDDGVLPRVENDYVDLSDDEEDEDLEPRKKRYKDSDYVEEDRATTTTTKKKKKLRKELEAQREERERLGLSRRQQAQLRERQAAQRLAKQAKAMMRRGTLPGPAMEKKAAKKRMKAQVKVAAARKNVDAEEGSDGGEAARRNVKGLHAAAAPTRKPVLSSRQKRERAKNKKKYKRR